MKDHDIVKLLSKLKDDPEFTGGFDAQAFWNRFARENDFPMNDEPVSYGMRDYLEFYIWQFSHVIARPMAIGMAVFALLIGGWVGASNASFNALPGDQLYSVKLTLEKFQLALTFNPEQKAKLQVEFTSRRLEEMVELAATSYEKNPTAVRLAVQQFKKEVESIREDLTQASDTAPKKELAKEVGRKTKSYKLTVADSSVNLPKEEVKAVETILEETEEQAVEVIITAHELSDDEAAARELKQTFEKELKELQAQELSKEQQAKLELAVVLEAEGAYRRAFQALKEVRLSFIKE